jgi:lipopolysaccharide biosynthesis glycosyltransferase
MNNSQHKQIHVFTSAALNYLPKVRVLFTSLRKFHPDWRLHLLLADENASFIDTELEAFDEVHSISELNIPQIEGWIFKHTIVELATAIKPFMLQNLLEREDCESVIYLDPDIAVFSEMTELLAALKDSSIVLTPHLLKQESSHDGILDNEISCLKHGIYNLGFIAIKANAIGVDFANWWAERLYSFCYDDIPSGLFTDQRWIDLVPAIFDKVLVFKAPQYNVAPWNLGARHLDIDVNGLYLINGRPLVFYHFSGFDSGAHKVMAEKNSTGNASVKRLIAWYENECKNYAKEIFPKWAFETFPNGEKITRNQRLIYRSRPDLQAAFPSPLRDGHFFAWWNTQGRVEHPDLFIEYSPGGILPRVYIPVFSRKFFYRLAVKLDSLISLLKFKRHRKS